MTGAVSQAAATVGLWWPAADEQRLRDAAEVWDHLAGAVDAASGAGRDAMTRTTTAWSGEAASAATRAWGGQDEVLATQATDARRVAAALREYAGAVVDAKRQVEELAAAVGATLVVGGVTAFFTFGISEGVAAGVTAELVSAAAAVGVELSSTVAGITGGALTAATFGAAESVAGDVIAQGVREGGFDEHSFSWAEVGASAAIGGVSGGVVGGGAGALAVGPIARTAAGDLSGLRAPGGRIRAVLDPPNWGAQGGRFAPGVHELPGARAFQPHELPTAELLASEGKSVHARAEVDAQNVKNPDALVRTAPDDPGTYAEFKRPTANSTKAVKKALTDAEKQLRDYGGGLAVIDGRAVQLSREVAEAGLARAAGLVRSDARALPSEVRILLGDGTQIQVP
jgi:hypothetical protein